MRTRMTAPAECAGATRRGRAGGACLLAAGALAAGALAFAGCAQEGSAPDRTIEPIRYRMPQDPPTLDPHDAQDESANLYVYNIFDGLVEFAPGTVDVAPAVARSWEVSGDHLTYTFRLREGVRFHNGREVTADDVVYSLGRAMEKGRRAAPRQALMVIDGAKEFAEGASPDVAGLSAPDPRTVVIRLSRPSGTLLPALATQSGSIVPREVYEDPGKKYLRRPVGCGPFRLEEYASGRHLKLVAFGEHWKGRPSLPGITVRIIPDVNTALLEYESGGLEICNEIPAGRRKPVAEAKGTEYRLQQRLATAYLMVNHASGPLSGNPLLRRAVNFAIDRERISSVLQEGKDDATSWILPDGLAGGRTEAGPYRYDPAEARRLLAEAGHPEGRGVEELTLMCQDNESIRRSMESIQNDLREVGLRVKLDTLAYGAYGEALRGSPDRGPDADLFVLLWFADYPDPEVVLRELFLSASPSNFSRYDSAAVDALLEAADVEPEGPRRLQLFLEAEQAILADGGVVPLYHQRDDLLVKPGITGVVQSPLGDFAIPLEMAGFAP